MTDQHPITPPPELVRQWTEEDEGGPGWASRVAARSAKWGADQELTECCKCIYDQGWFANPEHRIAQLRDARRPKPPSLKEQALKELNKVDMLWDTTEFNQETLNSLDTIRRALEALPDD